VWAIRQYWTYQIGAAYVLRASMRSREECHVSCRAERGYLLRDGGMLLDLSQMNGFSVDVSTCTATIQPGLKGADQVEANPLGGRASGILPMLTRR
jgi:hypothetical protein